MKKELQPIVILIADDDAEDRMLAAEALEGSRLANDLRFVKDGQELLDYLRREGAYAAADSAPRPGLVLLDLNMPRKDGRAVLQELKADKDLQAIPVVVLTSSKADADVVKSYDLGVSSYIVKPVTFEALMDTLQNLEGYCFQIVAEPQQP